MMEGQDLSPPYLDNTSRPSVGFPLGTALLLLIIFSMSGIFSCCYHCDKFRSLRQSLSDPEASHTHSHTQSSPSKPIPNSTTESKENRGQSMPVLMPGDEVPKFIAMPCPCQPWRPEEEITVTVEKPPPKPPRLPVPLY